jgi:hypothetical protein
VSTRAPPIEDKPRVALPPVGVLAPCTCVCIHPACYSTRLLDFFFCESSLLRTNYSTLQRGMLHTVFFCLFIRPTCSTRNTQHTEPKPPSA